ncbi:MAG: TrkH family potassium uptake protein [Planctomycetota bacterium]
MNFRLLSKLLGILVLLIGSFMLFSLIWADPKFGVHTDPDPSIISDRVETAGIQGLIYSSIICWSLGALMVFWGRHAKEKIFRKEAMAAVGLSWVLATVLGALPYVFSGTSRGPSIRTHQDSETVLVAASRWQIWNGWNEVPVDVEEWATLNAITRANARGLSERDLIAETENPQAPAVFERLQRRPEFGNWLIAPGEDRAAPVDRASHYRLNWVKIGLLDAMFEAQSGFSTTGATVLCDLEDPYLVPHCILFWRSSTHFLGGLGIIVLFVVLLGQNSASKALMRTEMPGPTQDSSNARMQHTAWLFAGVYVALNIVLAIILYLLGMSVFDALCHAFGTMATGGFSTYNASLGHFLAEHGPAIEYVVILFMTLAGANFTLLFFAVIGNPLKMLRDTEFQVYLGVIVVSVGLMMVFGLTSNIAEYDSLESGIRNSLFQVVSIMTTTGFGTADFDQWRSFHRGWLLALMFIGGCAGSTGGGLKVIRHVLFVKILGMEVDAAFSPKEVRLLRMDGKPVEDQTLRHSILVYFSLVFLLFGFSFIFVVGLEPLSTWGGDGSNKLIDSASAVTATLNNIGPGLGVVGPTQNYSNFSGLSKTLFILLMMLGRLEIFPILVLFSPRFWRDQ